MIELLQSRRLGDQGKAGALPEAAGGEELHAAAARLASLSSLSGSIPPALGSRLAEQRWFWGREAALHALPAEDYSGGATPLLSPTNTRLLAFFKRWLAEPDDKGEEWWASFEAELKANRDFEERDVE